MICFIIPRIERKMTRFFILEWMVFFLSLLCTCCLLWKKRQSVNGFFMYDVTHYMWFCWPQKEGLLQSLCYFLFQWRHWWTTPYKMHVAFPKSKVSKTEFCFLTEKNWHVFINHWYMKIHFVKQIKISLLNWLQYRRLLYNLFLEYHLVFFYSFKKQILIFKTAKVIFVILL